MKKILFPILATILSLTSLATVDRVTAQPIRDSSDRDNLKRSLLLQSNANVLTEQKWQTLAKRYYQSRYRVRFEPNNHFLSLKEVNNLLGLTGTRIKISKKTDNNNSHQYWHWRDPQDPRKKIQAVFVYHQLIGLRSRGFDRENIARLKQEIIDRSSR